MNSESQTIKGLPEATNTPSSNANNIVFIEFDRTDDIPLPDGYASIDEYIIKNELDDNRRAALEKARTELAEEYYDEAQASISLFRLKKGWSQRRLAEEIKTSQPHIARIESGKADLRLSTLKKLAEALNIKIEQVINAVERGHKST